MGKYLCLALILLAYVIRASVVSSYIDEDGRPIDHHVGTYLVKDTADNLYRVTYDVEMLGGNMVINLDLTRGVKSITCDISNTEIMIEFSSTSYAKGFEKIFSSSSTHFLTGEKWNCKSVDPQSTILMLRVFGASRNSKKVTLQTAQGHYEESIKEGSITLEKAEEPEEHKKTFCFGVNSNKECSAAAKILPLYSNKYISLQCSNCFVGAKATVFLDVKIHWFKLKRIATGLKDMNVNAALVMDLAAKGAWSTGLDKTYYIVEKGIIIQFFIGPIPISIWFEIPLHLTTTVKVEMNAAATAGATANLHLGDAYFSWDDSNGWKLVKPKPVFHWTPVLKGEANFKAEGEISIVPSFILYAMRIIQAGVNLEPTLMWESHGDLQKKELCADLKYQVASKAKAEVHINIPYTRIRYDKIFGPYTLFDTGVKPIGHWCVKS